MADIAVGLSKTAVEAVVNKVKDTIKEEAELLQILKRDLVFITEEFEMMQSFLNSADRERIQNNVVKIWVRQVRDLSYGAEDCIESVLHLDRKRSFRSLWHRLLASFKPGASLPLDEVVDEIKWLKARVEDVSQRNMRYSLIGDSGSKPVVQMQPMTVARARKLDIVNKARDTAKELTGFSDLAGLITNEDSDHRLHVISIWGTGDDLGAISVVKEAYDDPAIYKNFRYRAWVKLMHPFNPHEFMRRLVAQFYTNSCREQVGIDGDVLAWVEATEGADLFEVFAKQLNQHRYLIVLEDLSSMAQWHAVRTYLPDRKNRSRVVVSTQQLEIASSCTGHPYRVLELHHISDNHSVCVFFKEGLQRVEAGGRGGPSFRPDPRYTLNEFSLAGRQSEVRKLDDLINKPRVVSVWGLAGVGKSALVRTVYRRWRYDKYAWVNVSHPFNLMDFCRSIVLTMLPGQHRVKDFIKECRKLLHKDRCLLVIDGLQFKEDWDMIYSKLVRVPSDWELKEIRGHEEKKERLSCIAITTEERIAKQVASDDDAVCNVPTLQDGAALDLFRQVLCREMIAHMDEDKIMDVLNEEARVLLPNCGGLPSVIVALGRYLAHSHTLQRDIHEQGWKRLNANMLLELETNPEFDGLRSLFAKMHSSFHDCSPFLKKCIFYLSIFPKNSIIRRRRLVRRWLAEGYSKEIDSGSLEEGAENLANMLLDMGVMRAPQANTVGMGMTSWQVNSLFLEYILSHQTEDKIFRPLEISVLEEKCSQSTGRVGQHLAIRSSWKPDESMFNSLDFSLLRSLTVFGCWKPFFVSEKMKVLRVLDLEGNSDVTNDDLKQIVEKLLRLKFLSLRGCTNVSCLPKSLGDLGRLQTLDIRGTSITTLPRSIVKLQKLQYIRAGNGGTGPTLLSSDDDSQAAGVSSTRSAGCAAVDDGQAAGESSAQSAGCAALQLQPAAASGNERRSSASPRSRVSTLASCFSKPRRQETVDAHNGIKVSTWIGRLTALQTLGAVDVTTPREEANLAEIHHLKQLKRLVVSGIGKASSRNMFKYFSDHLESLGVRGMDLPQNIRFPGNLMKLSLEMATLSTPEDIQAIGKLAKLHTLRLFVKMVNGGLQFCAKSDQFIELKVLEIGCSSGLDVTFDEEAVNKLEQLKVHRPNGSLPLEFNGLQNPRSLKQVCIMGSCVDDVKTNIERQLNNNPKKPVLKLEE